MLLLGASAPSSTWESARPGYHFVFPSDYGAHERSRDEWWYYTGNLRDAAGHRYGFEETIFRFGVQHAIQHGSPWDIDDLYFAHFALTDVAGHRFLFFDRTGRAALGDSGAASGDEREWVGDWQIDRLTSGVRTLHAQENGAVLSLRLATERPPVINGQDGVSTKGPCATCASHYYSIVRLAATGTIAVDGRRSDVSGWAWNDHEWGSDELAPGIVGWDWFSMQLEDGTSLMLYRLRHGDGSSVAQSSGTVALPDGTSRHLGLSAYRIQATGSWTSPHSGATYPSGWTVSMPGEQASLRVTPLLADQELTTSRSTHVSYWEGACAISGTMRGRPVRGYGYTELTGYASGGLTGAR